MVSFSRYCKLSPRTMPALGAVIASAGLQTQLIRGRRGQKSSVMGNKPTAGLGAVSGRAWLSAVQFAGRLLRQKELQGCFPPASQTNTPGSPGAGPKHPITVGLPGHWQWPRWGDECARALRTQLHLCCSGTQQVNRRLWKPPATANDQPRGDFFSSPRLWSQLSALLLKTPLSAARLCFSASEEFL